LEESVVDGRHATSHGSWYHLMKFIRSTISRTNSGLSGLSELWNTVLRSSQAMLIACLAMTFTSCALIKPAEAPRETFDLSAPLNFSQVRGRSQAQILVKTPTALKYIDSDRLILKPSPTIVNYLAGAQWADTVPQMVQARLVETFENTGATKATAKPGDGLVIDFQLVSDIRKFEIFDDTATIEISIKLLTDRSGLVRQTRIFEASTIASGSTPADYVDAFNESFERVARDIVRWVIRQT